VHNSRHIIVRPLLAAILFASIAIPCRARSGDHGVSALPSSDSVSIDGITWRFSTAVPVGRFVNGDYYVVGNVTVIAVNPPPTSSPGRNGSVLNMPVASNSLSPFDDRVSSGRYAPQLRVNPPFTMHPGDALISSISVNQVGDYQPWLREGEGETPDSPVRTVSVLTCLGGLCRCVQALLRRPDAEDLLCG